MDGRAPLDGAWDRCSAEAGVVASGQGVVLAESRVAADGTNGVASD